MTAMVRITLDLPRMFPAEKLGALAAEYGCKIYRREDGTYLFRPSNPTRSPVQSPRMGETA